MNHSADNSDIDRLEARAKESYNFIATELANYNCIQSLICLKNFIGEMRSQGGTVFTFRGQQMGYHVFPFFIDLIIRYCTVFQPTRQFDYDTINFLIVRHEEFPEILQQPNGTMNLDKNVPEWLIRASFGQLVAQEMKRTLSSRMLYFYQEIPKLYKLRHETFQNIVKKVFEVQFRVNLEDLILCAVALSAIAKSNDRFQDIKFTDMGRLKPCIEGDDFRIVRNLLSLPRDEYIKRAKTQSSGKYIHILTEPKLILKYPIIEMEEHFTAPDPHLIIDRVTRHLHDSVYQYFIDNDRIQEYAGAFGDIYKDYIGILLKECYGSENVFDLDKLDHLDGRKADWLVVAGDKAGIFECKAHRYPKELKRSGSLDILNSFVKDRFGSALVQLNETDKQWQKISQSIPQLQTVRNTYKFLVLEEHFHLANYMGKLIPNNITINLMLESQINIISTLDLETVVSSNYLSDFENVFVGWRSSLTTMPSLEQYTSLEQYVRGLPKFSFTEDNILERKFREFFHIDK